MQNLAKIKEMFLMQQRLNDETNGFGWEDGYTKNGKLISWKRCIYMECAELIDSFAWKHWKNIDAKPDIQNIIIEIVDIWHFVMSLILEKNYKIKNLDEILNDIVLVSGYAKFTSQAYNIDDYNIYEIINDIELLIHQTSGFNIDVCELLTNYFRIALKCGVNLEILFEMYIGKNVLNKFRQDNGYKEGNYKKLWNGVEDNVVLGEILKSGICKTDEIYANLQKKYNEMI